MVALDSRFVSDKMIPRWILPRGPEYRGRGSTVLFNSLDHNVASARQKALEFNQMYESGNTHKVNVGSSGAIAVITSTIPNGVNVDFAYKTPDILFRNIVYSKDLYQFIFSQTQGAPCIITNSNRELCVDWDVHERHYHLVLRRVKYGVNPAKLLFYLKRSAVNDVNITDALRRVSSILQEQTEPIFKE